MAFYIIGWVYVYIVNESFSFCDFSFTKSMNLTSNSSRVSTG
ncbi:hypothetical protein SAMN05421768_10683 [Chryseobacterium joostei]|uniref:Uncharacterized protein n=1 Tax=Chryseobacterium joostei TaxID=112234 RepID=A0A1N7IMH3_9FLAO|nr:hypothetical protein SAMN05421768_10683 [Chryseobacterium joostei]